MIRRLAPWTALIVVLAAAAAATIGTVATAYTPGPPIRSDGLGYHAWTRAILEGDLRFCQWESLQEVQAISVRNPEHPDRCGNKYPPGLALLRLPFMAPVASLDGDDLVPGDAEHGVSLGLGVLSLGLTCFFLLATLRLLEIRPLVANGVTLAAVFGTGLFHYATFDSSFTHAHSAALVALVLFLGVRAAVRDRIPSPVAVAALAFGIVLVRPPDLLLLLVLLGGWLVWRVRPLERSARVRAALRGVVPVGLGAAGALAIQLGYNRWSSGAWALSSYGEESFDAGQLKQGAVLFSYERGLFTYYPALAVLLGAALVATRSRRWGWTVVAAIALLATLYGSWHSWMLGAGFGHRGFVEVVPLAAVAGALGIASFRRRAQSALLAGLAACVALTLVLMSGYWQGTLPIKGVTQTEYWDHVAGLGDP